MRLRDFECLLKEASKLNIFDLAYEFSAESLNSLSFGGYWEKLNLPLWLRAARNRALRLLGEGDRIYNSSKQDPFGIPRKGIAIRIGIFIWHFNKSLIEFWRRRGATLLPGGLVFFALSKNEVDSLKPVCSQIPKSYLTGGNVTPFPFPFIWAYVFSFAYLPLVVINFLEATGYRRRSFAYVFDQYWLIYGLYIAARIWFCKIRPKVFILANHVYPYHRVMLKAACDEGIRTVSLQHASIPERCPTLTHDYDYVLLEGQDALNKTLRGGATQTRIFLIGMPKHDAHFQHINVRAQVCSLGMCTSNMDPLPRAEQLLARIRQEFATLSLILRPHNADLRTKEWHDLARKYGIEYSDSKTELSFDFLRKVDAIIAGDSNILLEAALMNVVPLYYDFAQAHLDWYGFQRSGLVEYFSEIDSICDCIRKLSKHKPDVRMKAKFYCATIGTRYDGHSGELAAALIQSLVSGAKVDRSIWKRIPDFGLEAYELAG